MPKLVSVRVTVTPCVNEAISTVAKAEVAVVATHNCLVEAETTEVEQVEEDGLVVVSAILDITEAESVAIFADDPARDVAETSHSETTTMPESLPESAAVRPYSWSSRVADAGM